MKAKATHHASQTAPQRKQLARFSAERARFLTAAHALAEKRAARPETGAARRGAISLQTATARNQTNAHQIQNAMTAILAPQTAVPASQKIAFTNL